MDNSSSDRKSTAAKSNIKGDFSNIREDNLNHNSYGIISSFSEQETVKEFQRKK